MCNPLSFRLVLVAVSFWGTMPLRAHDDVFHADVTTTAKPWTNLEFQNDPNNFQFAIITDRTGGPREGVFEDAVKKLNWMMPEFVMSVGDFIKGTSANADTNAAEWDEIMAMVAPLKMPLFFVAGNHDIQMKAIEGRVTPAMMKQEWNARFGPTHYSFVYKNVLFVALFTNDGQEQYISEEQANYFDGVMAENPDVRWTIVSLHHPLWAYPQESNFSRIEQALQGRKYTVFAGHHHRYVHFDRNNTNYYILASTGGVSKMRGPAFGEFDHFAWVTMTDDGPVIANLDLAGILPHDVTGVESLGRMKALENSAQVTTSVILDQKTPMTQGAVFMMLTNATDQDLTFTGEFRHSHHVHPTPGKMARTVAPRSQELVEIDLDVLQSFTAADGVLLEFEGQVGYADNKYPGMTLPIDTVIPLANEQIDFWGTESAVFVGSHELKSRYQKDARVVRYTLDGSTPTARAARFDGRMTVTESAVVQARLFTQAGLTSAVSDLRLEKIPAGEGLLAHYYELNTDDGPPKVLPDFRSLTPTYTRKVSHLDLDQLVRRPENFGAVFFGSVALAEAGNYGFHLKSADGARLLINGRVIIDDPLKHGTHEASGFAKLPAGKHRIEVQFFQANRYSLLELEITTPDGVRRRIAADQFSFDEHSAPDLRGPENTEGG